MRLVENRNRILGVAAFVPLVLFASVSQAADGVVFVEAESFAERGGWKLDTQFIEIMGSPYLLAHGLGEPVADARTTVTFPEPGDYRVFVRTKDWVARFGAPGTPGRFRLLVNGTPLATTFGTEGAEWHWQDGGTVTVEGTSLDLRLRDLAGFGARCDAILFARDPSYVPPNTNEPHAPWRRALLGLPAEPIAEGPFDLVVVGGGYSGCGAAISAARMGLSVALIQNRGVLGGNSSSEIRVWPMGKTRRGLFPRIGEIIEEFSPNPKESPGTKAEFEDEKKTRVVSAEPNIALFLNHHAFAASTEEGRLTNVTAFDTRTGAHRRFTGRFFVDATGHGTLGALAGADHQMTETGHLGMSNMWRWAEGESPRTFPETPWALDLEMDDFPYPGGGLGKWFWETGFDRHPIHDLEYMRDWNHRAVFGAFNAMKNRGGKDKHRNAHLTWVAHIGGTRESRRLLGDVILSKEDVVGLREFADGCVPSTWAIDLHYPEKRYTPEKYENDPFISRAEFDHRVDEAFGYPVPYRCFYSRNVPNLFMAGRCISVTHEALGTVRVMKTCGMMGEVVGKAASICVVKDCSPRDVYAKHLDSLKELLRLPGVARRDTIDGPIRMDGPVPPLPASGIARGLDPTELPGIVIDDRAAQLTGSWGSGTKLEGYIGWSYRYASPGSKASARFAVEVEADGTYEIRLAYRDHENRASDVPVRVRHAQGTTDLALDMTKPPPIDPGFVSLGRYELRAARRGAVIVSAPSAGGHACIDAVQVLPIR